MKTNYCNNYGYITHLKLEKNLEAVFSLADQNPRYILSDNIGISVK